MNARLNSRLVVNLMAVALVLSASLAVGGELGANGPSQAPGAEPRFKAGDTLTIAADSANLMLGSDVAATLPRGQRIVVVEVRGSWIGTHVSVNGQQKAGWIEAVRFIPASVASRVSNPNPYVASYYHTSNYGDYDNEHGIARDNHSWEPWRYQR